RSVRRAKARFPDICTGAGMHSGARIFPAGTKEGADDVGTRAPGMNKQKWLMLLTVGLLMGSSVGVLMSLKAAQRLGAPGLKTTATPGSDALQIELPESVLDYRSTLMP